MMRPLYFGDRAAATAGTGRPESPFDETQFEARMAAAPAGTPAVIDGCEVLVRPTREGQPWQAVNNPGFQVRGSLFGQNGARIKLVNPPVADVYKLCVLGNAAGAPLDGVTVENVEIDCNAAAWCGQLPDIACAGLMLWGRNLTVRNVKVLHAYGCRASGREAFPIALYNGSPQVEGDLGNLIDGCSVAAPLGDYSSGLTCGGGAGRITNSRVTGCDVGITAGGGTSKLRIDHNHINDCNCGLLQDTGGNIETWISDNQLLNIGWRPGPGGSGGYGVNLIAAIENEEKRCYRIHRNTIELKHDRTGSACIALNAAEAPITGVDLLENTCRLNTQFERHSLGQVNAGSMFALLVSGKFPVRDFTSLDNRRAPSLAVQAPEAWGDAGFYMPEF